MISTRYQTGITAQAGCMGTRADSREGFALALSYPIDCLEAHLQISEHGHFYLSHEPLAPREQAHSVPLKDLLDQVVSRPAVCILLDVRDPHLGADGGETFRHLETRVRDAGLIGRIYLKSVDPHLLPTVRSTAPDLPFWATLVPGIGQEHIPQFCTALVRRIRDSGAIGLHTHYRFVTQLLRQTLLENDLLLSVWDVDHERDMRRLLTMAVDSISTRRIQTVLELRSRAATPPIQRRAYT